MPGPKRSRRERTDEWASIKHWKFFGANGLPAGEEVSVWVYENTLKVEYQATTLSLYSIRLDVAQQLVLPEFGATG